MKLRHLLILLLLGSCQQPQESVPQENYTDILSYGPYAVGFETNFTVDLSREAVPYSDWSGKLYPSADTLAGRSLPLSIWYPAVPSKLPLHYDHFVHLITRQSEYDASSHSDSLAEQIFIYQTNELGGNGNFTPENLAKLLNMETRSFPHARSLAEKFPLIVFPNGTSPAGLSIMCEYLASHGYIVASLPLKGQFSHVIDASARGLEVAVDDLEFALQHLLALDNVDGSRVSLLANAIESSFCAGLVSRNEKIKALISLDGGFLSRFEQDILDKTSFYAAQNISIPILSIYAPHPAISPDYIKHLRFSKRYFAHFPEMSEFHFLNYGLFEKFVPGIIGEAEGNIPEGYIAASELTRMFLDAELKGKPAALDSVFGGIPSRFNASTVDSLFQLPGLEAPPNIAILKDLFITRGMASVDSIYQVLKSKGNEQPFSKSFYQDYKDWLAWKKDPDYIHRKHLYELAVDSYPNSALNNYRLAYYLKETGNQAEAKTYFSKSLTLLETDPDIDAEFKKELEEAILAELE